MVLTKTRIAIGSLVVSGLFVGCAYDWSFPGGVPANPDGGGPIDSANDTNGNEGSPPPDQFTPDSNPTGDCKDNSQCKTTEYCHFSDQRCGTGTTGKCALPETTTCTIDRPVCTCSGQRYETSCLATQKREDLGVAACPKSDSKYFLCGYRYCQKDAEICVMTKSATGTDVFYACETIAVCGPPAKCSCPEPNKYVTVSGCTCSENGAGGVTVVCTK